MRRQRDPLTYGPAAWVLGVTLWVGSLVLAAAAQEGRPVEEHLFEDTLPNDARSELTGPIERVLAQAEQALEEQELQLAESRYRDALRECWLLMNSLETVDGDLAAARDALRAATRSAVTTDSQVRGAAVAGLPEAERSELRAQLTATLGLVYRNLGVLCAQSRRPSQAEAHFARADALDPPVSGRAEKAGLGLVDLRRSPPPADIVVKPPRPDEDEEQLAAAIAAASATALTTDKAAAQEISHLHQRLARLHLTRGHEERAAAELRTAAGLGALDLDLGLKLAELEAAGGDAAAARRVLQVLTTTQSSPRALLKLAELTWSTGPPKSLPILLQARALAPNSEEALGNTANAYLAAGEPDKALEALAPLIAMNPGVVVYLRLLGEAYTKLGRLEEAVKTLREAVALAPSYVRSRVHLSGVLLQMKRFDEAEAELRGILAVDPERPEAKDLLEFLEKERGSQKPVKKAPSGQGAFQEADRSGLSS